MSEDSGALVWWILVPLFVAVGIHLVLYSRRKRKMLEAFANSHQLCISPESKEELQKTLENHFSLKQEGLVRSFEQLSSIVDGGSIWIFRVVELLDLDPHAQSSSAHFSRIVALFEVAGKYDEFFIHDRSMQVKNRVSGSNPPSPLVTKITNQTASSCNARHPLSVTLAHGRGLVYFETLVTGGETMSDIDSLYCIARKLGQELGAGV